MSTSKIRLSFAALFSITLISACSQSPFGDEVVQRVSELTSPSLVGAPAPQTSLFGNVEKDGASENSKRAAAYHYGIGVAKSVKLAEAYYRQEVRETNSPSAMNDLGVLLVSQKQHKEAFKFFKSAAKEGNPSARFNLGLGYLFGYGGLKANFPLGLDYIETAANQGSANAQSFLVNWIPERAQEYAAIHEGIDDKLSIWESQDTIDLWKASYSKGEHAALWDNFFALDLVDRFTFLSDVLAVESQCAECSTGSKAVLARKLSEIEYWREKLSQEDHVAMYNLGLAYLDGNGVPHDRHEGARLIVQSAEAGYVPAQYTLGKLYLEGRGIEKNDVLAYGWFNLAAAKFSSTREARWAAKMRDQMEESRPDAVIAKGQDWSTKWQPKSGDKGALSE